MAALSYNMTYLSLKTKLQVIFTKALQATKTLFGVPTFITTPLPQAFHMYSVELQNLILSLLTILITSNHNSFKKLEKVLFEVLLTY
jgi:hypothetical protein